MSDPPLMFGSQQQQGIDPRPVSPLLQMLSSMQQPAQNQGDAPTFLGDEQAKSALLNRLQGPRYYAPNGDEIRHDGPGGMYRNGQGFMVPLPPIDQIRTRP